MTRALRAGLVFLLCFCAPGSRRASPGPRVTVGVSTGMSERALAACLHSHGVIDNAALFSYMCRGHIHEVVPGRYRLAHNSDERQVLRVLTGKAPAWLMVTLPEGLTKTDVAAIVDSLRICPDTAFLAACRDSALLRDFGIDGPSAEGYLFPETYELGSAMSAPEVVRVLVRQFFTVWNGLGSDDSRSGLSLRERVTLASIVEREARMASEYPLVAGVFVNRLRRRMPLQSCATVEYVLPERKTRLDAADLAIESPYNTYLHLGLPPGPICNPGRAALAAALAPTRTDYLYFVYAGNGRHVFSRTFAEHEAARRRLAL